MSGFDPLFLTPVDWQTARGFTADWHRHNAPPVGWRFGIGVATADGVLRGVAVISRPVARHYDDGATLEVTRCTTDGTPNACSCLYGAAWRAVKAMGYRRLITYTRADEPGSSLRGAGWRAIAERPARGRGWDTPSRRRGTTTQPRGRTPSSSTCWPIRRTCASSPTTEIPANGCGYVVAVSTIRAQWIRDEWAAAGSGGVVAELDEHGTRGRYLDGCRCGECRAANAAHEHARRRARVVDPCGCTG